MFVRKTIAPLSVMLLLSAAQCHTQGLPRIRGSITLSEGWKPVLYLVQPRQFGEIASNYSGVVVDSAAIGADGHVTFTGLPLTETATLFQICVQKRGNRYPNQLMDEDPMMANYMPVVLQKGESVVFSAKADQFQATFSIQNPAPANEALLQLREIRHKAYAPQSALLRDTNHSEESLLEQEAALQRYRAPLMAFADSSASFWASLVAARWVSPTGDYERVPEFLVGLCQKWREKTPDNPFVTQLCKAGSRERLPVLTGDRLPNFPLPMVTGDTSRLEALLGSRLTILDIWASWCMPCRRENRLVLLPLWAQYQEKGLQIVGYSLDSSPAAWRAAIAKDGAPWLHASHLSGDATPFLDTLRIRTIPANLILDAQGVIVAKNLHGDALKAYVDNYFGKK